MIIPYLNNMLYNTSMKTILIILGYLRWHYGKAIISLTIIWKNFLNFIFNFFSINLLFKNFFDPWKRMTDSYPSSFDLKKYFYAFMTNMIVRVVGMLMRGFLIIIGLAVYVLFALLYPVTLIIWLVLPLFVLGLFLLSLFLIIK